MKPGLNAVLPTLTNDTPIIEIIGDKAMTNMVLLPGWGSSKEDLRPLAVKLSADYCVYLLDLPGYGSNQAWSLCYQTDTDFYSGLLAALPQQAIYIGWSLGGNIALALADFSPQSVLAVVTIATNPRFIGSDTSAGMDESVFTDFSASLREQPRQTLQRFVSLQLKGEVDERLQWKKARQNSQPVAASQQVLNDSLAMLGRFDQRAKIAGLLMPVLAIVGRHDALVPVQAVASWPETVAVKKIASGHRPFTHYSDQLVQWINHFTQPLACLRDKTRVAESFSRAALSYDGSAQLQRDIADHLLALMAHKTLAADSVVIDLGCGTGYSSHRLAKKYPNTDFIGVDIAEGMLHFARQRQPIERCSWLAADAEALPFADHSVDIIFSSLAVQWCEHLPCLLAEIQRILKPGGVFYFSTLVDGTLAELKQAWSKVDDYVHVNDFTSQCYWQDCIEASSLSIEYWQPQTITLHYDCLSQLTSELKAIGAHNVNSRRPEGLVGRAKIKTLKAAYEVYRDSRGKLPASYQVLYSAVVR